MIGSYFYRYLFLDIFSRKIVGWQIYDSESSELAGEVMLHSDNGSAMKGATMLATLQHLGVVPTFPSVCNDNPYSESVVSGGRSPVLR